jgi:hypothetical protein
MTASDLPILAPADVTPEWITKVLHKAGRKGVVTGLTSKRVGTGQVGESYRFTLDYQGDPQGSPPTLVGKFPASDPVSRATGVDLGNYVREVRFYQQLQSSALISTPVCLHTDVDPVTSDFVLMMDDLAPAQAGDQTKGISVDQAVLAMGEAAKLHGSHWNDRSMESHSWISDTPGSAQPIDGTVVQQLWQGFLERYGDRVKPNCIPIGETIANNYAKFRGGSAGPKCLVHVDFRPDNMMFATAEGGRPITVVDWQSIGWGCCMADVSYFLAGAVTLEERRANEKALLKDYHQQLQSLGVSGYSYDDLWRDYAHHSFALFNMGFIASMIVERTPRGDDMFFQMLETGAAMVEDLEGVKLLKSL